MFQQSMSNNVTISGDLNHGLDWLQQNGKRYFQAALYSGASVLKEQTKTNLTTMLPAATRQNQKYHDTLLDAIRNTHSEGDEVKVHILGTRASGSGTYRTRFFEKGTKQGTRYQKTRNGKPLKKKKFVGQPPALHFFSTAVESSESQVINAMEGVINNMMNEAQKNQ